MRRIINVPRRGIGATTINKVQQYADENGMSFYDALRQADQIPGMGRSAAKLEPFVTMIQSFRAKLEYYSLEQLINEIIENTGYVRELESSDEEDAQDRIDNINELISKIVAFETVHEDATLSSFLAEVALVADIDNVDADNNRVLLMTLHSAKGLEFPVVYLAGMEDGLFPSYMSITSDDPTAVEEERRLAYVGITRAKKDLTLTCAKQRLIRGETQYNAVSRFVREIPGNLLDERVPGTRKFSFGEESGRGEDDSFSGFSGFSGFSAVRKNPKSPDFPGVSGEEHLLLARTPARGTAAFRAGLLRAMRNPKPSFVRSGQLRRTSPISRRESAAWMA